MKDREKRERARLGSVTEKNENNATSEKKVRREIWWIVPPMSLRGGRAMAIKMTTHTSQPQESHRDGRNEMKRGGKEKEEKEGQMVPLFIHVMCASPSDFVAEK